MIKIYPIKYFSIFQFFKRKLEGIYSTSSNNTALLSLKIKLKKTQTKSHQRQKSQSQAIQRAFGRTVGSLCHNRPIRLNPLVMLQLFWFMCIMSVLHEQMFKRLKGKRARETKRQLESEQFVQGITQHTEPKQCGPKWGSHFISSQHIVIKKQ